MESLQKAVTWLNAFLSDYVLTVLLIGCGVFFSIRTRFVQFRCFGEGIRNALGKSGGGRGISPFQSLMAAVAAQVGTGNIVGASGAILIGGPGAIFWMWVIASFGMATIYAEAVLAQKTRRNETAAHPRKNTPNVPRRRIGCFRRVCLFLSGDVLY